MSGQRYACRVCGTRKVARVKPSDAPLTDQMGCEQCGRLTKHGRVPWGLPATGR